MNIAKTGAVSSGLGALVPQVVGGFVTLLISLYGIALAGGHASSDADFLHWLSKFWLVTILGLLAGTGAGSTVKGFIKFKEISNSPTQPSMVITAPAETKIDVAPSDTRNS